MGKSFDMNIANFVLLVVVLILVVVCCVKKPTEEFKKQARRNYTCKSISLPPGKDTSGNSLWTGYAGNWGSTYTNNSKRKTYRATRQAHCDAAIAADYQDLCDEHKEHPNYYSRKPEDCIQLPRGGAHGQCSHIKNGLRWEFGQCGRNYIDTKTKQKKTTGVPYETLANL
jgi:hypothetical protein